jgi:hypothetical protein
VTSTRSTVVLGIEGTTFNADGSIAKIGRPITYRPRAVTDHAYTFEGVDAAGGRHVIVIGRSLVNAVHTMGAALVELAELAANAETIEAKMISDAVRADMPHDCEEHRQSFERCSFCNAPLGAHQALP